jgi:hypothetical protein
VVTLHTEVIISFGRCYKEKEKGEYYPPILFTASIMPKMKPATNNDSY